MEQNKLIGDYTPLEKQALFDILFRLRVTIYAKADCPHIECLACDYFHLCRDICHRIATLKEEVENN